MMFFSSYSIHIVKLPSLPILTRFFVATAIVLSVSLSHHELRSQSKEEVQALSVEVWSQIKSNEPLDGKIAYLNTRTPELPVIFKYLNLNLTRQDSLFETFAEFASKISNMSPKTSFLISERLLGLATMNNDTFQMAEAYFSMGSSARDLGNYQDALLFMHKNLELTDETSNPHMYAKTLNGVASIYDDLGEFTRAIEYHEESLSIAESIDDQSLIATGLLNIATPYLELGDMEKVIHYLEKARLKAIAVGYKRLEAYAEGNLAYVYMSLGQPEKGIEYQSRGLKIEQEMNDKLAMIDSHGVLALCYGQLESKQKVRYHMDKSLSLSLELNAAEKLMDVYKYSAEVYHDLGEYKMAYDNAWLYHELYDSLQSIEKNSQVAEIREKYETEKKEVEIVNLQRDNQLVALELDKEKSQKTMFIIIAVLFLAIIISIGLFFLQARKQKNEIEKRNELITGINKKLSQSQDALLESNEMKDKFFALIAHDLRGPITSFQGIGAMIQYVMKKGKHDEVEKLIQAVDESANGVNLLLDNLLKWSMSQTNDLSFHPEPLNLKPLIEDIVSIYRPSYEAKNIQLTYEVAESFLVFADQNMVSTVLRNIVGNAIKFTRKGGAICCQAIENGDHASINVIDNGVGIAESKLEEIRESKYGESTAGTEGEKGTGLGLVLCNDFARKNGGRLTIQSPTKGGTVVTFTLPICKKEATLTDAS